MEIGFRKWGKTARVNNARVVITEKLDGTNASIHREGNILRAGSRTRWITPEMDNHGFATWVRDNADALLTFLKEGWTYGEWIGKGINRNYGLDHKEWRIFSRFYDFDEIDIENVAMVPLMETTTLDMLNEALSKEAKRLSFYGSLINGFKKPEGMVAQIQNQHFKYIIDK
jgi:hypothetical protein